MNSHTPSRSYSHSLSRNPFCPTVFLAPDDGGNDPGADNNKTPATPPAGKSVAEQVQDAIADLLGKKGNDPMAAMDTLIRQNHALEQRAKAAESSQLPKADRDLLAAFKALNLKPDEVKQTVAEHQQWSEERARNAKRDSLKAAAEKAGLNPELLASLEGALDAEYSVVGEGENAKAVVKVKNGDSVADKALSDWVAEKWPSLQETLKAAPANGQVKPLTRYGASAPAQSGQPVNRLAEIKERKAKENEANAKGQSSWTQQLGMPE